MPKTFKNKKVIISKKELKSKNQKKTNVGRIKIQKRRTIRGRNNNTPSVNRQRSISRKSINKRNISIRKRTKKNMKGGARSKPSVNPKPTAPRQRFDPKGTHAGKSRATLRVKSIPAARTEGIPPSQISDMRRKNRENIFDEIINKLNNLQQDQAKIPQETAERLSMPKEGNYSISELNKYKAQLPKFNKTRPIARIGHVGSLMPKDRRTSVSTIGGISFLTQRPYIYYINNEQFETEEIEFIIKSSKSSKTKSSKRNTGNKSNSVKPGEWESQREEFLKGLKNDAWNNLINMEEYIIARINSERQLGITQETINQLSILNFEELFIPTTERTWIEPLYQCLCYNFGNKVSGKKVATYDYSYDGLNIKFNRNRLLQNVDNSVQCYRTMSSQKFGEHPLPFKDKICPDLVESNSDSCWLEMDTTVDYNGESYNQYKYRNQGIKDNEDSNPYSQCWLCGCDLVCNVKPDTTACQKPPQCEHKLAVMEGILLSTIPHEWKEGVKHYFGDHGYAPSCGFCNETKSNIIMSSPEMIPYAVTHFGHLYKYVWMPNRTNIEILFNNYKDIYRIQKLDIDRKIQFELGQWEPIWDIRFNEVFSEIESILENSLNNPVWLLSIYYNSEFYSHKIYCEVSYREANHNISKIYINPFQLLAHVINRQYMAYYGEIENMYVVFHAFLSSYVIKTPIVLDLKFDSRTFQPDPGDVITLYNGLKVTRKLDTSTPSSEFSESYNFGTIEVIEINGHFDNGYFTIPQINNIPTNLY